MRRTIELLLRFVAVALLATLLWRHLPRDAPADTAAAPIALAIADVDVDSTGSATADALVRALLQHANDVTTPRLHLAVPILPGRMSRAALAAASGGGMVLSWTDSSRASGLAVAATSTPGAGDEILIAASGGPGALVLRDDGGVLDSLPASAAGASLLVRRGASWVEATQGRSDARVNMPSAVMQKRILLYGRPGWEAKFTIAALEEAGWQIDATLPVSPTASVTVGAPMSLDTARYAAAIVIEGGLAGAATLLRFVAQGGGVILGGDALSDRSLAGVAPVRTTGSRPAIPGGLLSPSPTSGLEAARVSPLADAIVLQREADRAPSIVVMRRGAGRVLASVYRESWRWRMEGGDDGVDAHRAWWNAQLRAVAYAPPASVAESSEREGGDVARQLANAAPYADLVARLGAPSSMPPRVAAMVAAPAQRRVDLLLLGAALAALLAEWASRRLRGAR